MRGFLLFALWIVVSTASYARNFTVDDLLSLESYGQVAIAERQDLLIVERRRPYAEAPDFGYDTYFNSRILSRVLATSISDPQKLSPLFPQDPAAGYWIGGLSPDGSMVSVFRLRDRRLALGIVDLATRQARWFNSSPDMPNAAGAPVWISDERLAFVAMTQDRLPAAMLTGTAATADLVALWRKQARGLATRTTVSSRSGPDGTENERRLVEVSIRDGRERTLTTGAIVDLSLAPGGKRLAVVIAGGAVAPPNSAINVGFDSRRHHLRVIDTVRHRVTDVDREVLRGVLSWSHEGHLLAVTRDGQPDWSRGRWMSVAADGRTHILGAPATMAAVDEVEAGRLAFGGWAGPSPIARVRDATGTFWARLTVGTAIRLDLSPDARPVGTTPAIKWLLDGRSLRAVTAKELWTADTDVDQTGPFLLDPYTPGFRVVRDPPILHFVVSRTSHEQRLRSIDERALPLPSMAVPLSAQVLAANDKVAVVASTDRRARTILGLVRRGGAPVDIDTINANLSRVDLPETMVLTSVGRNGERLYDWLLLPRRRTGKLAMVVNPYPGRQYSEEPPREAGISRYAVPDNALLLTSAGYAVLLPSMPEIAGASSQDGMLRRIESATDTAVASRAIDPARIALQGHSFGGYAALVVATRSSRFKAIVAANGHYDLLAAHGMMLAADKVRLDFGIPAGPSIGWAEGGQGALGKSPAEAAEAYVAASPMFALDRARSPILLISGDLDPVDVTQSERAFMELYREGKDATLVRYWGEGHANASPGNIRDYWELIIGFLDTHLKSGGGLHLDPTHLCYDQASSQASQAACRISAR